jgi:hypothetical protein
MISSRQSGLLSNYISPMEFRNGQHGVGWLSNQKARKTTDGDYDILLLFLLLSMEMGSTNVVLLGEVDRI